MGGGGKGEGTLCCLHRALSMMQLSRQEATGLSMNILETETKGEIVSFLFLFSFVRQFL